MNSRPTYMKPLRWLAHLPLAILPFLAAAVTEGPRLERAVAANAAVALAAAGQGWAKVSTEGRDLEIRGEAPSRAAAEAARAAAATAQGVRRVVLHVVTREP